MRLLQREKPSGFYYMERNVHLMKSKTAIFIVIAFNFIFSSGKAQVMEAPKPGNFDKDKDLLLAHYDCKTDVDDLQTVAAFATLLSDDKFSRINYHAVAGAYGIQEGLYVPPNDLFELAFGDNWTDAHENFQNAVTRVKEIAIVTLEDQGDIWIADAGQSDFSAELIKSIQADLPGEGAGSKRLWPAADCRGIENPPIQGKAGCRAGRGIF